MNSKLRTRPFQPEDQTAVKTLILAGLVEHWGFLDSTLNPDLNDIALSYVNGIFLVATVNNQIVGTGALIPEKAEIGRVVRMSINKQFRRQGIGYIILDALCKVAKNAGYSTIVCETTSTWQSVVTFYLKYGFQKVGEWDGAIHFQLFI